MFIFKKNENGNNKNINIKSRNSETEADLKKNLLLMISPGTYLSILQELSNILYERRYQFQDWTTRSSNYHFYFAFWMLRC
jgi:hypothetical protein